MVRSGSFLQFRVVSLAERRERHCANSECRDEFDETSSDKIYFAHSFYRVQHRAGDGPN